MTNESRLNKNRFNSDLSKVKVAYAKALVN